jgi:hypothetical protein
VSSADHDVWSCAAAGRANRVDDSGRLWRHHLVREARRACSGGSCPQSTTRHVLPIPTSRGQNSWGKFPIFRGQSPAHRILPPCVSTARPPAGR